MSNRLILLGQGGSLWFYNSFRRVKFVQKVPFVTLNHLFTLSGFLHFLPPSTLGRTLTTNGPEQRPGLTEDSFITHVIGTPLGESGT